MEKEELGRLLFIVFHPTMWKILRALKESKEPLRVGEIAEKIGEDKEAVAFHLSTLLQNGFVKGEYAKGKAKSFWATDKMDKALGEILELLKEK